MEKTGSHIGSVKLATGLASWVISWMLVGAVAQPAQTATSGGPWYLLSTKADQLQQCAAPDQEQAGDPVATALAFYGQALEVAEQAQSSDTRERGVFKAIVVKKIAVLKEKQRKWLQAYHSALDLHEQHAESRAEAVLDGSAAPPCWPSSRDLLSAIHQQRASQESELAEADHLLQQAQSSLDTTNPAEEDVQRAEQFYQQAISKYSKAQQINVDDKRASAAIHQIESEYRTISARGPHDILILSKPLGAKVVWYFRGHDGETKRIGNCPTTPCKRAFGPWYFDETGGNFVFSKRLHGAIYVRVMKEAYQAEDKNLTEECRNWSASLPGDYVSDRYCYFTDKIFRVPLIPL